MRKCFLLMLAFICALPESAQTQQSISLDKQKLVDALRRMQSEDMIIRESAFDDLKSQIGVDLQGGNTDELAGFLQKNPEQAEQVKLGLIQLLNAENKAPYAEHYPEVVLAVSALNDERAIPALVGAMTTGQLAVQGIKKYGDRALVPVLEEIKNSDELVRSTALAIGVAILAEKRDSFSRTQIANIIDASLVDPEAVVRRRAVFEIGCIDERLTFVPTLERIAKTDPTKFEGVKSIDGGDGGAFYPVRYAAREVLRGIHEKKPCP